MAYKRELISSNQPIQLLDKSKYSETVDSNGRVTVSSYFARKDKEATWLVQSNIPVIKNHKYYAASNYFSVNSVGDFTAYVAFNNGEFSTSSIVDSISSCLASGSISFYLKCSRSSGPGGVTAEATAGPQLFDLTATFGAGNEPSTVAEFKAKYPNDLYDYRTSNSLTSYKKLLKVSDVCQLLDKKTYEPTHTTSGVVYTNNGDGTITVNSLNITANTYDNIAPTIFAKKGHKYCVPLYGNYHGGYFYIQVNNEKDNYVAEISNGIYEVSVDNYRLVPRIVAYLDSPIDDKVYKPQLFDLTEMYGAGNEPTTVDEFKAKFPNELYDYSPRCWVKSYKTMLIVETKNLFNINALTPYTPETLPPHTAGRYNGNIITKCDSGTSVSRSNKLLKELCPNMVAGERYILHFDTNGTGSQANTIYLDGTETVWRNGYTHVVTEAELNGTVFFYGNYPSLDVATISNFQIEKGTTATDYVPYGYL